ncbi:MAG: c-type cytochrome [Planctomycetales bacterium]
MRVQKLLVIMLLGGTGWLSGCGQPPPARFALHSRTEELIPEGKQVVEQVLQEHFGNPNQLVAWEKFPIDYGAAQPDSDNSDRKQPGWRLKEGRNLYMQHCLHCHGVAGDGAGPTARFLNPRPRDYRQGIFKFKSTLAAVKPSRADLERILKQGIPGTYMPSFVLLGDEKLGMLSDYVRWLSCRGEMEIQLSAKVAAAGALKKDVDRQAQEEKTKPKGEKRSTRKELEAEVMQVVNEELAENIQTISSDLAELWSNAESPENVITPKVRRTPPTKDSIARGKKLYLSQVEGKKTQCADCHGPLGRGDGPNTEQYWEVPGSTPKRNYDTVGLHDIWGFPQKPRNLTRGIYRGGRRPADLYRRIFAGIQGTQMPAFGVTVLNDEEIWDLVNYVLSIPFDGQSSPYPEEAPEEPHEEVATSGD